MKWVGAVMRQAITRTITWINVDSSSVRSHGVHPRANPLEMFKLSIIDMRFENYQFMITAAPVRGLGVNRIENKADEAFRPLQNHCLFINVSAIWNCGMHPLQSFCMQSLNCCKVWIITLSEKFHYPGSKERGYRVQQYVELFPYNSHS